MCLYRAERCLLTCWTSVPFCLWSKEHVWSTETLQRETHRPGHCRQHGGRDAPERHGRPTQTSEVTLLCLSIQMNYISFRVKFKKERLSQKAKPVLKSYGNLSIKTELKMFEAKAIAWNPVIKWKRFRVTRLWRNVDLRGFPLDHHVPRLVS